MGEVPGWTGGAETGHSLETSANAQSASLPNSCSDRKYAPHSFDLMEPSSSRSARSRRAVGLGSCRTSAPARAGSLRSPCWLQRIRRGQRHPRVCRLGTSTAFSIIRTVQRRRFRAPEARRPPRRPNPRARPIVDSRPKMGSASLGFDPSGDELPTGPLFRRQLGAGGLGARPEVRRGQALATAQPLTCSWVVNAAPRAGAHLGCVEVNRRSLD